MAESTDANPPAYDSETVQDATITLQFCQIDYLAYVLPGGSLSDDRTAMSIKVWMPADMDEISKILDKQATLPPRPTVRIRGFHTDWVYSWGNTRTDFDLQLDVTALIMPTSTTNLTSRTVMKLSGLSNVESLQHWFQRLLSHEIHSVTVDRIVTNWDTLTIEKAIRDLILSAKYQGSIEITFPVLHSKFVVTKPNYSMQTSSLVKNDSLKWYSHLKLAPLAATTMESSVSVIQVHWPYASTAPHLACAEKSNPRIFAVQSEISWLNTWKDVIRNGVISRKVGWLSLEDWKDVFMDGIHQPMPHREWGTTPDDISLAWKGANIKGSKRDAPENYSLRNVTR